MLRLNVGCGRDVRDEWVNVDVGEYDTWLLPWVDARSNINDSLRLTAQDVEGKRPVFLIDDTELPFADDLFDGAVAHHVLQMIAWHDLVPWLSEVRRVLKPGAWLRITVPNFVQAVSEHQFGHVGWFPISDEHEQSIDGKLCMYVSQAGATRSVFTRQWLMELIERAGFDYTISPHPQLGTTSGVDWLCDLDSRLDESIVVEARK